MVYLHNAVAEAVPSITAARPAYLSIGARAGAIPELDGLRGIAILLVLLRHAAVPIYEEHGTILRIGSWDLAAPLLNGWMGVDLFFVLSGFLITHHLTQHWPQQMNASFLCRYWLKRVLRTFPAYFTMLFLVAFGLLPFYRVEVADFGKALAAHAVFMQDYYGAVFVPAFWSLGVEEKFYLLSPFVLFWLRRVDLAAQIRLLVVLALTPVMLRLAIVVARAEDLTTYPQFFWAARAPFHLAMDGLWIGAMCALLYGRLKTAGGASAMLKALFFIGAALLALALPVPWFDGVHMTGSALLLLVFPVAFACILLAATLSETPINAWLRSRWLRFWAIISYSVYLTHMTIVPAALHVAKLATSGRDMAPLAEFLVFLVPFVVFACASGLLLHLVVEKPFLLLKDRVRL